MFSFSSIDLKVPAYDPGSSGFHRPFAEIPGDNRKAGVDSVTRYALIPAPVHPMVPLQVADHRFNAGPQALHPPKPGFLFMWPLRLALVRDCYLPDHWCRARYLFLWLIVAAICRDAARQSGKSLLPLLQDIGQRFAVISVVRILRMADNIIVLVYRKPHLAAVFVWRLALALPDAGDVRLMKAVELIRNMDTRKPCRALRDDLLKPGGGVLKLSRQTRYALANTVRGLLPMGGTCPDDAGDVLDGLLR